MSSAISLSEFERMVREHDLTYSFSDDHRDWMRGRAQRDAILEAAKLLPRSEVVRVWNEMVDKRIVKESRNAFYWTV